MLADTFIWPCSDGKILESLQLSILWNKICNITTFRMARVSIRRFLGYLTVHWVGHGRAALSFKVCRAREILSATQFPPCKGRNSISSCKISFSIYLMEHYMHASNVSLVPIFTTFLETNIQKESSIFSRFESKEIMSQKRERYIGEFEFLDFKRLINALFPLMKDTTHHVQKKLAN